MNNKKTSSQEFQISVQKLKDMLKRNWTKLTEDEIDCYEEKRDVFIYIVQSKYKVSKEQAEDALRYVERQCCEAV